MRKGINLFGSKLMMEFNKEKEKVQGIWIQFQVALSIEGVN